MILRKGWGIFGPLPVGVKQEEYDSALAWISAAIDGQESWDSMIDSGESEE